ncbi:MAG: S8 family serine peptidase [Lysobacter sp.]|nr:S8 family serine peptidase [Lysobacter sp.]MDQ3270068.1 S8 family serine peptidase [Pseudomonadota bacterium]
MNKPLYSRASLVLAIAAGLAFSSGAHAEAIISTDLQQRLAVEPVHEVIVTFSDRSQIARLQTLTTSTRPMQELPMAGAVLTSAQVQDVSQWAGVESIYFNAPLEYFNYEAGEITGGHTVHDQIGLKGAGVTVAVLDSGVDANHPDLQLGSKTIQNVKIVGDLGLTGTSAWLENQFNTDTSSGHGTHVAGTVGGTGAASAGDARRPNYYAGIAPEVNLVGLGAGEGISILFALQGFDYALVNQERYSIDIITNSWGSSNSVYDPNNPINKASFEAYKRGMVVAFAAGNDGPDEDTINPYAIVPWTISVGSGTKAGDLSSFSSQGVPGDPYKHIDVVAPGSGICSTRAPGTVIGALGPVVNATYPSYTAYYHCISGTSMATPFVAGTAALLLEANPELSPDQIEEILMQTATPMPNYAFHEVGGGYINVLNAVDLASRTEGKRQAFLDGVTAWSSQGIWNAVADSDPKLGFGGNWQSVSSTGSTDGTYKKASVTKKSSPRLDLAFQGQAFQLLYPRDSKGGLADVYVDDVFRGRISYFDPTGTAGRFALNNLSSGLHHVQLRGIQGNVYFDGALVDGKLFSTDTKLVEETETFTGTMGPSVENLEIDEFKIDVGVDVTTIRATLAWDGGVDIDFSLLDPNGVEVASGATLANPETLEYGVTEPGVYTYQVKGYATVLANYTLQSTQVKAVVTSK